MITMLMTWRNLAGSSYLDVHLAAGHDVRRLHFHWERNPQLALQGVAAQLEIETKI